MASTAATRLHGTEMPDHLQAAWRAVLPCAPGGSFNMMTCDPSLDEKVCLTVTDLVDPERGLITIVKTEGLDMENRRFILGSVVLAVYRYGLDGGEGTFDHDGEGPGAYVVLEEARELFGESDTDSDKDSVGVCTALYESLFRRCRALSMKFITLVQNPASNPAAVTFNTSNISVHMTQEKEDRDKVLSMLNWSNTMTRQLRKYRYLGEMAPGEAIVRLPARTKWLEAALVLIKIDSPDLARVSDETLVALAL